jgi:hypothetical protein
MSRVKHDSVEQIPQSEQLHEKYGPPAFSQFRVALVRHFLLCERNWQIAASERFHVEMKGLSISGSGTGFIRSSGRDKHNTEQI